MFVERNHKISAIHSLGILLPVVQYISDCVVIRGAIGSTHVYETHPIIFRGTFYMHHQ